MNAQGGMLMIALCRFAALPLCRFAALPLCRVAAAGGFWLFRRIFPADMITRLCLLSADSVEKISLPKLPDH
jgi:hypothetical protein